MYGIDSGNGYVYSEDDATTTSTDAECILCSTCVDTCPEQAIELGGGALEGRSQASRDCSNPRQVPPGKDVMSCIFNLSPVVSSICRLTKVIYFQVGKQLKALSVEMGREWREVPGDRYNVKAYHVEVIVAFRDRLDGHPDLLGRYRRDD